LTRADYDTSEIRTDKEKPSVAAAVIPSQACFDTLLVSLQEAMLPAGLQAAMRWSGFGGQVTRIIELIV
jgi:hypothetical protein